MRKKTCKKNVCLGLFVQNILIWSLDTWWVGGGRKTDWMSRAVKKSEMLGVEVRYDWTDSGGADKISSLWCNYWLPLHPLCLVVELVRGANCVWLPSKQLLTVQCQCPALCCLLTSECVEINDNWRQNTEMFPGRSLAELRLCRRNNLLIKDFNMKLQ